MRSTRSPVDTRLPTWTSTSSTVPAAGAGMSMVALSDSRVRTGSSAATTSPGTTWTSMTGTSAKSPMSGMRMSTGDSRAEGWVVLEDEAADVLEQVAEVPGEARGGCAVDHPVVVGQGERQHQPRHERGAVPHRGGLRSHHAQDGDLGGVHQRGERRPADAAEAGDGETATLQVGGGQLAVPGPRGRLAELAAELPDPLAVDVADDRDDQALGRVYGDADVEVPLEDQGVLLRGQAAVEPRELAQRRHRRLEQERQQRDPVSLRPGPGVELLAVGVEVGDVGLVVVGDVRDVQPRAVQVRPGQPLDAGERLHLDRPEPGEVLRRDLRDAPSRCGGGGGGPLRCPGPPGGERESTRL